MHVRTQAVRATVGAGAAGLLAVLVTSAALASTTHAALESTRPAAGDTLVTHLDFVRLVFSEPVDEEFSLLTLTDGTGRVTRLKTRGDPTNVYALIADCPELPAGGYLVSWRVVSADGHPVGGHFQFYSAIGPAGKTVAEILAAAPRAPDPPGDGLQGRPAGTTGEPPVGAAILRGAAQVSLLALTGLLFLAWLVPARTGALRRIETGLALVTPFLLAADFYLWLQHAAPTGQVDGAALSAAFSTRNGLLYGSRVGLALLAAWGLILARSRIVGAVLAALVLVVSGATGHPAVISPAIAIPAKIVHLAAIALWTGGLLVLAFGNRLDEQFRDDAWRVSRLAVIAVAAVAATGVLETWLLLPRLNGLFSSAYGWLVLAKLAGLGVLVAFGARNRYRLMPRLQSTGPGALRRSVTWETGWMVGVVILAAFLSYLPPPMPTMGPMTMNPNMRRHVMPPANPDDQ